MAELTVIEVIDYLKKTNSYIEIEEDGSGVLNGNETEGIHYTPFGTKEHLERIIKPTVEDYQEKIKEAVQHENWIDRIEYILKRAKGEDLKK